MIHHRRSSVIATAICALAALASPSAASATHEARAAAVAANPGGGFVAAGDAGATSTAARDFGIARYTDSASLDSTFGAGGKVRYDFAAGRDDARSVAVQPDGRIVAVGTTSPSAGGGSNFAVVRYMPDGTVDGSFGTNGSKTIDFVGYNDAAEAVTIQPDGKIVVAGSAEYSISYNTGVARLNIDGSLDSGAAGDLTPGDSFGTNGKASVDVVTYYNDGAFAVAVQPDGKIVTGGNAKNDFALVRFTAAGALDSTFGSGGKVVTDVAGAKNDNIEALVLQRDGRIAVAGWTQTASGNQDSVVARYNVNGSLDSGSSPDSTPSDGFATNGKVIKSLGVNAANDQATTMDLRPDGRLVIGGWAVASVEICTPTGCTPSTPEAFASFGLRPDGSDDPFYLSQKVPMLCNGDAAYCPARGYGIIAQADGGAQLAGWTYGDPGTTLGFTVAHFTGTTGTTSSPPNYWDASVPTNLSTTTYPITGDTDQDGIPDTWEMYGVDLDGAGNPQASTDGTPELDLPGLGANRYHKDIFVEVDSMPGFRPNNTPSDSTTTPWYVYLMDSFQQAPISNPDGTNGIKLHIDNGPDTPIAYGVTETWGARSRANDLVYTAVFGGGAGQQSEWDDFVPRMQANFPAVRLDVFYYVEVVDGVAPGEGYYGQTNGIPGNAFYVAMGNLCRDSGLQGACPAPSGRIAGTFMHEMGHTVGLRHGGFEENPYKPNYLSVMNGNYVVSGMQAADGPLYDFSNWDQQDGLAELDEANLNEPSGFETASPPHMVHMRDFPTLIYCRDDGLTTGEDLNAVATVRLLHGAIDFNCDGDTVDADTARDIDNSGWPKTTVKPFNDWRYIQLNKTIGARASRAAVLSGTGTGDTALSVSDGSEPRVRPALPPPNEYFPDEVEANGQKLQPPPEVTRRRVSETRSNKSIELTVLTHGLAVTVEVRHRRSKNARNRHVRVRIPAGHKSTTITVDLGETESSRYDIILKSPQYFVKEPTGALDGK